MIIVNDQWTAIVANFVRMSPNSFWENYNCVMTERGRKNVQVWLERLNAFFLSFSSPRDVEKV